MKKISGTFTIILACCYLAMGIFVMIYPKFVFSTSVPIQLELLNQNPPMVLNYVFWAVAGIAALLAVPAVTSHVDTSSHVLVKWGEKLAILAYAVIAISNFRAVATKPQLAQTFVNANEPMKEIIAMIDPWLLLTPKGYIILAGIGTWILILSIYAIKKAKKVSVLNMIGICLAIALLISLIGIKHPLFIMINEILKGTLSFIWFIWLGISMWKSAEK